MKRRTRYLIWRLLTVLRVPFTFERVMVDLGETNGWRTWKATDEVYWRIGAKRISYCTGTTLVRVPHPEP